MAFDGVQAARFLFDVAETRFLSGDIELAGRLVLPPGGEAVPILVQVHGSEHNSALLYNFFQQMAPALGVGVFVYDKRGTGKSSGKYTQDFALLAADAAAAANEARRLAGTRAGRIGLHGSSQGGWVAPLAARTIPVDFVIVGYGLAESPLGENREQTIRDVAEAGYGPEAQASAAELADAAGVVMASRFRNGLAELDRLKSRYSEQDWYEHVKGDFTGELLRYPTWMLRIGGPLRDQGTSWTYDPLPTLRALTTPVLWILAGADREAPPAETRRRLHDLAAAGRPITVAEFPGTDHGILEFEFVGGNRTPRRYADCYFRLIADWALGRSLHASAYGSALIAEAQGQKRPNP